MIDDWKYCIVQMPCGRFCPSCFKRYRGPTGTNHNETDSSVSPVAKEKKITQGDSKNWLRLSPLGQNTVHSIVLPFENKLQMAESKYHMISDPWKEGRWLLWKLVHLESPGVIQVHCYLWSCPTLCSPRCAQGMGGPRWPRRDASWAPGSVDTRGKCGCGCSPSQPEQPPAPVCGRGALAVPCPRKVCRCWGWRLRPAPGVPPGARAEAAAWAPPAGASPAGCRDTERSPGAPAASPHTLTAASTHTGRKR